MTKKVKIGSAVMGLFIGMSGVARAQTLLNGGFEATTNGNGQLSYNTTATGWTVPSGGYAFLFASGTADTTGAVGQYGTVKLWGPNDGSANGMPVSSPNGGNFVALDGGFQIQPIQQTVTNLIVGNKYAVSFYWAGAQQLGRSGATKEQFKVSFGGDMQSTALLDNAEHGFTGWQAQTFTYTAHSTSQLLSFLAVGTPAGEPPFSLLDGVSVAAVPEPTALAALFIGVVGSGVFVRRRARSAKSAK